LIAAAGYTRPVLSRGYLTLGRIYGADVRLHWSILVGMLVLTRFHIAPGAWLGFLLVLLLHELGHAFLAYREGMAVIGIDVHGLGGQCTYAGLPTARQQAIIAWGGVIAQGALLVASLVLVGALGWPRSGQLAELLDALTWTNVSVAVLNLLPIPPLDGADAWTLFRGRRSW
jgi:stage IV sporulation protein FB